jgi:hypothetical protein
LGVADGDERDAKLRAQVKRAPVFTEVVAVGQKHELEVSCVVEEPSLQKRRPSMYPGQQPLSCVAAAWQ